MNERGISGTEAMMGIMSFASIGFLGEGISRTWIKENVYDEERGIEGRSNIVINNEDGKEFYIVNSESMTVDTLTREEIIEGFNSGKYEYRSKKHTIEAIEGEVPIQDDEKEGEKDDNTK